MSDKPVEHRGPNHIACRADDIGRYVLLPGDPGRVPTIAQYLDGAEKVASNREFTTYTGALLGEKVSVTSTGIGCPSAAIAVEELARMGAEVFIRVGTSGLMQRFMGTGDLVIAWGAVRDEYTTQQYLPLAYPAVADLDVTLALSQAAEQLGLTKFVGTVQSKDSFFGEHEPKRMPVGKRLLERHDAWQQAGVLCSEMEASTIFVLSRILGKRAGGVMVVGSSDQDLDNLIRTAIGSIEILIRQERQGEG